MMMGEFVRECRLARQMTVCELAEKCNLMAEQLIDLEMDRWSQPPLAVLRNLACELGISYPYLLQLAGWLEDSKDHKVSCR